jgi:hypothetical protein
MTPEQENEELVLAIEDAERFAARLSVLESKIAGRQRLAASMAATAQVNVCALLRRALNS